MDAILAEFEILERNPFTCPRVSEDPFERELVVPFGKAGYAAHFRVLSEEEGAVPAIRHQRAETTADGRGAPNTPFLLSLIPAVSHATLKSRRRNMAG